MTRHVPLPVLLALSAALVPTRSPAADARHATAVVAHLPVAVSLAQASSGEFGAVIDSRRTGVAGRTVLAVTPGETAARMGLLPGDVIVSINGDRLDATDNVSSKLRSASTAAGTHLSVGVLRDGRPLTLSVSRDQLTAAPDVNAVAGCGYLSGDGASPRNTQGIYPVEILNIDGTSTPAMSSPHRHRIDAGRRVLILRELVDDHRFTPLPLKERRRLLAHDRASAYKVLIVDVDPDTRYDIGARLKDPRPGIGSIRNNTYWEPVVWRRTPSPCATTQKRAAPVPASAAASATCAYVTAYGVPADRAQRVFPVAITAIDGLENFRAVGDLGSPSGSRAGLSPTGGSRYHRLAPGRHTLTVRARADVLDLPSADKRLIEHHQRSAIAARADHSLTFDADPSRGYWIGGRLRDEPINRDTVRTSAWWEPVLIEKPEAISCP